MTCKLFLTGLAVIGACLAQPLACNLKAFTPQERAVWRERLDHVMAAVTGTRELEDGYALEIDTRKQGYAGVAQWVELERKCCPFFVFELGMRGENGAVWLNLRGGKGVKEFIAADFRKLFDRLAAGPSEHTRR